ncbi:hypothetical protein GWI33_014170 [Rhynchophorus ferrugineus]|uniref:Uncharacterized protein n=1 Tax=Rhynchophorus ferrugineus TaxID=354439 RepID=A0A834MCM2_RHYFE|nr:hypothetical protein GWI33_014170 [Rhynchophorus ferrugineus]
MSCSCKYARSLFANRKITKLAPITHHKRFNRILAAPGHRISVGRLRPRTVTSLIGAAENFNRDDSLPRQGNESITGPDLIRARSLGLEMLRAPSCNYPVVLRDFVDGNLHKYDRGRCLIETLGHVFIFVGFALFSP